MILTATELVCPSGTPGASPIVINLAEIYRSEARQDEVAVVTPTKAPELLAEFNRSWSKLDRHMVHVAEEHLKAQRALEQRQAYLTIEVVPGKLKEKGLSSNDANRTAFITLDDDVKKLQDTVDQLEAVVAYLRGKMTSFNNAYSSVKKIFGESTYSGLSRTRNYNLSGDAGDSSPADPPPKTPITTKTGWGKTKYSF